MIPAKTHTHKALCKWEARVSADGILALPFPFLFRDTWKKVQKLHQWVKFLIGILQDSLLSFSCFLCIVFFFWDGLFSIFDWWKFWRKKYIIFSNIYWNNEIRTHQVSKMIFLMKFEKFCISALFLYHVELITLNTTYKICVAYVMFTKCFEKSLIQLFYGTQTLRKKCVKFLHVVRIA